MTIGDRAKPDSWLQTSSNMGALHFCHRTAVQLPMGWEIMTSRNILPGKPHVKMYQRDPHGHPANEKRQKKNLPQHEVCVIQRLVRI